MYRPTFGFFGVLFALAVLVHGTASAGSPDYTLRIPDVAGLKASTVTARVLMDNVGDPVQGWSFGVCYDPGFVTLQQAVAGTTTATINNGAAPDFVHIGSEVGGVNMLVVVCYMGCATLGVGSDQEIVDLEFSVDTLVGTSSTIVFCETVGVPATENLVVVADTGVVPTLDDGVISSVAPEITYTVPDNTAGYDPVTGNGSFIEPILAEELSTSTQFPNDVEGFSMAFAIDPARLVANSITQGADLVLIDGGNGPDFFAPNIGPDAVTVGIVFSFLGGVFMQLDGPQHIADVSFSTNAATFVGDLVGSTTDLVWADGIGPLNTENALVIDGESYIPLFVDGTVTFIPVPPIEDLVCTLQPGAVDVVLTWVNAAAYDSILVRRNGVDIATLGGAETTYSDLGLGRGVQEYDLIPVILDAPGSPASCTVATSPPLTGLVCALAGPDVTLSWDPPAVGYDSIRVFRDAVEIEVLPGDATGTVDVAPTPGFHDYDIYGEVAGQLSDPTSCTIEVFDQPSFVRGDSNADGAVDIADPVFNLNYLFVSGPTFCLDAQDGNDDGGVDIADPIYNLTFLFQSGPEPLPPFGACGQDPTADATECDSFPPCN